MEAQREKNLSSHKGVLPEVAEVGFKPRLSAPEHGIESLSYIIKKKKIVRNMVNIKMTHVKSLDLATLI